MQFKATIYGLWCSLAALCCACSETKEEPALPVSDTGQAFLSMTLGASATRSINTDPSGEDRVTEVRMVVCDQTGKAIYNALLDFPNGLDNPCRAVALQPGVFNFYFFANETANLSFSTALAAVTNESQFQSNTLFRQLAYNPAFTPGSDRFLMSACYKSIALPLGGTETNPLPLPLPTPQVQLVRSQAKVEVIFRKKVAGSFIAGDKQISSVQLQTVARTYSIPPVDAYYTGQTTNSNSVAPSGFDYNNDSIGSVVFYIPELLNRTNSRIVTTLYINNRAFPIQTPNALDALIAQQRMPLTLYRLSIVRNNHYRINAHISSDGGVFIQTNVVPWLSTTYRYMFQDTVSMAIPPVDTSRVGVIVPTACGKIEIRSTNELLQSGLQGAFGDVINYWDPTVQGPKVTKGKPPFYCERKYGPGWRLINSCELMSFLALFDQTFRIWQSNTYEGYDSDLPFYPLALRREAQNLLEKLTDRDLSASVLTDNEVDQLAGDDKLGIVDAFFTPADIVVTTGQYTTWPYPSPPSPGIENWYPMEVVNQVKAYWYPNYLDYSDPANHDKILYEQFQRYSFSSTQSRCVRSVE